jgi:hypothetical protein
MHQLIDQSLQNPNALQNLGIIDRLARVIIGTVLIGAWFLYPIHTLHSWFAVLPLVGVYPFLTGILGWCPLYAAFHKKSCGINKRNTCGTFPAQLKQLIHRR